MPGRRMPKRPRIEAAADHLRAVFPGALSGSSVVPHPIVDQASMPQANTEGVVRFATDTFMISTYVTAYGSQYGYAFYPVYGESSLFLSHEPIEGSETVYLLKRDGTSQVLLWNYSDWKGRYLYEYTYHIEFPYSIPRGNWNYDKPGTSLKDKRSFYIELDDGRGGIHIPSLPTVQPGDRIIFTYAWLEGAPPREARVLWRARGRTKTSDNVPEIVFPNDGWFGLSSHDTGMWWFDSGFNVPLITHNRVMDPYTELGTSITLLPYESLESDYDVVWDSIGLPKNIWFSALMYFESPLHFTGFWVMPKSHYYSLIRIESAEGRMWITGPQYYDYWQSSASVPLVIGKVIQVKGEVNFSWTKPGVIDAYLTVTVDGVSASSHEIWTGYKLDRDFDGIDFGFYNDDPLTIVLGDIRFDWSYDFVTRP